ncbi:uncharacterized protein [Montipora capricornis]|uniref:uncharacterized protein isoform X4 n=1 Tax=Montipora capricornis TaxID=246305 RepID=UPI0035F157C2
MSTRQKGMLSTRWPKRMKNSFTFFVMVAAFFQSEARGVPDEVPTIINITARSPTSVAAFWKLPKRHSNDTNIRGFKLLYRKQGSNESWTIQTIHSPFVFTKNVTGLEKYTLYEFHVLAFNLTGDGPKSFVEVQRTMEDVPSKPPSGFSVTTNTSTSVTSSWQLPPVDSRNGIIKGFKLFVKRRGFGNESHIILINNASSHTKVITGLDEFTEYEFQVLAFTSVGDGPNTSVRFARTKQDVPSKAPTAFKVTAISSTSVQAFWQAPPRNSRNGIILGFKLFFKPRGSIEKLTVAQIFFASTPIHTKNVTGLKKFTEYEFQVLAFNSVGDGPRTFPHVVTTMEDVPSKAPTGFTVTPSTSTSIRAFWQLPPKDYRHGIIRGFKLFFRKKGSDDKPVILVITNSSISAQNVTSLDVFTEYEFQVLAFTSAGDGQNSSVQFVKTKEDVPSKAPTGFTVMTSTSTSIRAFWQLPPKDSRHGIIRGFKLFFRKKGSDDKPNIVIITNASNFAHNVTGLDVFTEYEFQVLAFTSVGDGQNSSVQFARTKEDVPSKAPTGFTVMPSTSTSIRAFWQLPPKDSRHGIIRGFKLFFRKKGSDDKPNILIITNASNSAQNVTGLDEFTEYEFQVLAFTSVGDGPKTSLQFVRTKEVAPSEPPGGFKVMAISSTDVIASWKLTPTDSRSGIIKGFKLFFRRKGSDDQQVVLVISNASIHMQTVTGLNKFTEYEFQVSAFNSVGDGPKSSVQYVKTKNDASAATLVPSLASKTIEQLQHVKFKMAAHGTLKTEKNTSIFNYAAHYWPLNSRFGIMDVITNATGTKHGKKENIFFKGPGRGYLHVAGKAWIDLGNFTGSCLAEPVRCNRPLTVFLWLKYSENKNKRYLVGTSSHLTDFEGFAIYKESNKIANNTVVVRVNDGQHEWTRSLTLPAEVWSHVAFTWERNSGLALFQNCRQKALVSEYTIRSTPRTNRSNILQHYLTLSGDPDVGVKASFEDLTVLYRKMDDNERARICHFKLDAPKLNTSCQVSERWLSITWKPPPMTYDILTGYNAWHWNESSSKWRMLPLGSQITSLTLTNLDPGSWYKFRVENSFLFGSGSSSSTIKCKTKTEVLNPPMNVSVEMKSSSAVLLKWNAPAERYGNILGYKITYTTVDFHNKSNIVKAGHVSSFLLTELQRNTKYGIEVASYGDKRFEESLPASTTVQTDSNDETTVKETYPKVIGSNSVRFTWKKPRDKYKEFSYRAFIKWTSPDEVEKMLKVCDGEATFCVYPINDNEHKFYVMALVIREIPLVRIVDPPRDVAILSLSWSHVFLNWTSPFNQTTMDFADRYRLVLISTHETIWIQTNRTFVGIDGLKQKTKYELNLQAWNRLGYGPFLKIDIHFRTPDHDECADKSHTCHKNAACINTADSYECECEQGFIGTGTTCEEIPEGFGDEHFCTQENVADIEWRKTMTQRQDVSSCPEGTVGMALRRCSGNPAVWNLPDLSDCVSKWMADIREQLNNSNVSSSFIANQLSNLTDVKSGKPLYAGDLKLVVDVIGVLTRRGPGNSNNESQDALRTFVKDVVGTASNILDNKNLRSWTFMPKESQGQKASSLIDSLDVLALDMANGSDSNATEMKNIVITVSAIAELRTSKSLVMTQQEKGDVGFANAVSFPASIVNEYSSTGSKPDYATFVSYKTLAVLLTPRGVRSAEDHQEEPPSINSAVVSLNLRPLTKKPFKDPVVITLQHTLVSKEENNASCVFLDIDRNISWSHTGCQANSSNTTHTVCHCYHLTSFAVLMSVKQDISAISKGHQLALSLITYIGVSISVVALCLAFLTFYFFRFSKSGRTFIHKNLTIALIFAQVVFLFGINKTANKLVCKSIAIALHYFFLVSFAWMALEGVMLYLMLVKVFHTKTSSSKTKKIFFSLGWGLPVVIVVTSGVMFHQGYGTPAYCWLSLDRGFIWSFVGPVLLVLAFNFICLGMTFRIMSHSGPASNKKRTSKIRRWSKACMLLTCILGLTWLFGVFYINQESLFMAYFFTVFNTLQGVFIFLFHCVGDEKVRLEYRRVLCCIDPDKRYLLTKPSHSMSNSKSDSSSKSMKNQLNNFKAKTQTLSGSSSSEFGSIESKRNTFVVHVSDGQVRVRGLASDEQNRTLMSSPGPSDTSRSSFGQISGQSRKSRRQSSVSRSSGASDSELDCERIPLNGLHRA